MRQEFILEDYVWMIFLFSGRKGRKETYYILPCFYKLFWACTAGHVRVLYVVQVGGDLGPCVCLFMDYSMVLFCA